MGRRLSKALMAYEPAFRIVLFVFVLFILIAFSLGVKSFLDNLLGFKIDPISQASALALACAVNSEAAGYVSDYTCQNDGITSNAGSIDIQPLYTFDDAVNAIEAGQQNPTAMMLRDMNRIKMRVENLITGLFGIKLAYAEEKPVGYSFGNSVVVCANKTLLDNKKLWNDPANKDEKISKYFSQLYTDDFKCKIFNFYLKQEDRDILSIDGRASPAFVDPDVIIYYNSFPEEEARAWLEAEKAADIIGMVVLSGVINMVLGVGSSVFSKIKEVKNAIIEMASGEAEVLSFSGMKAAINGWLEERATTKILKDFVENGDEYLAKAIYDDIQEINYFGVTKDEIKTWLDDSFTHGDTFEDFLNSHAGLSTLPPQEKEYLIEKYGRVYDILKATRGGVVRSEFVNAIFNTDTKIAKTIMKHMDDEAVKTLTEKESVGDAMEYVSKYFKENPKKAEELAKDIRDELKYYRLAYIIKNSPDAKAKAKAFGEAFIKACKDSRHCHFFMLQALDEAGVIDEIFPSNDPDLMFLKQWGIDAFECNRLMAGNIKACALAALFYAMNQVDATLNYKNMMARTNSILVYAPRKIFAYLFELEANPEHAIETIPLIKEASAYLVMLDRSGYIGPVKLGENTLLYLASPCKVDLLVEKSTGGETCKVPVFDSQKCREYVDNNYNCKGIESTSPVKPGDRSTEIEFYREVDSSFTCDSQLDTVDDDVLLTKLEDYVKDHIKTQTVAESIDPDNATLKHREFCIAMKNICDLLPGNEIGSICDNKEYNRWCCSGDCGEGDTTTPKKKSCAYAAEVVGAGGVILYNDVMYPTYPAVMCVDKCDTQNPVWGLFKEGYMAVTQYYDSSSFKWYIDGSVNKLRVEDTLPLHFECETSSAVDDFFTWLGAGPPEVHPPAIYVRPVARYGDVDHNFCFWGAKEGIMNNMAKAVVSAITIVGETITIGFLGGLTGGVGLLATGLVHFGFGAAEAYAYAEIDASYEWPNNPVITGGFGMPGLPLAP